MRKMHGQTTLKFKGTGWGFVDCIHLPYSRGLVTASNEHSIEAFGSKRDEKCLKYSTFAAISVSPCGVGLSHYVRRD